MTKGIMVRAASEIVFVALVGAGIPLISWLTMRDPQIGTLPRPALYASAALSEWIFAVLGLAAVKLAGLRLSAIGLRGVAMPRFALWTFALAAASAAGLGIVLLLEQRGWWPDESELVYLLMPRTPAEKVWALLLVAPTAALAEEFLYRGYLLTVIARAFHSVGWAWALSSVAFGLAHIYQRPNGIIRAAALGALLGWPVVRTGSLYPAMAAHFLIDAVALGWLGPGMLKSEMSAQM
jgi:membrane protease YdiL (CAAX protease family)